MTEFTDLSLRFKDFRTGEDQNSLHVAFKLTGIGIDTGSQEFNDLLANVAGNANPLLEFDLQGQAEATLDLTAIEAEAAKATNPESAFKEQLPIEFGKQLEGAGFGASGKIFHLGDFSGQAIFHTVTVDPDGIGGQPAETASYRVGGFRSQRGTGRSRQ